MSSSHDADRHQVWPPLDQPNELVQRLRSLEWPQASPEARQRCWLELTHQLDAMNNGDAEAAARESAVECPSGSTREGRGTDGQHDRRFGRNEFAIRFGFRGHTGALGERVAATRGLARAARS
jgi:hypothetical protein